VVAEDLPSGEEWQCGEEGYGEVHGEDDQGCGLGVVEDAADVEAGER
jgi:hypothetical protein